MNKRNDVTAQRFIAYQGQYLKAINKALIDDELMLHDFDFGASVEYAKTRMICETIEKNRRN